MPRLRLAAWNVAWFAHLFDRRDRLVADEAPSAMPGVTRRRQAEAIATVLRRLDADLIAVIEAPNSGRTQSCVAALGGFAAAHGLRQRAAVTGFESPTHQEIALLFDPDRIAAEHAPIGAPLTRAAARAGHSPLAAPRFDSVHAAGGRLCQFSKPPLEAAVRDRGTGRAFRLIAVHLKSQAANVEGDAASRARRVAENLALQRLQAGWIRARVEEHLAAGEEIAILGDFNDGPGSSGEASSVRIVAGDPAAPGRYLVSPFLSGAPPAAATARFPAGEGRPAVEALVDFILLSPGLAPPRRAWRIWHPVADPECRAEPALAAALAAASDHFPVTADLDPGAWRDAGAGANGRSGARTV